MNFNYLGLKKLIATSYVSSPISGGQISLFDIFNDNGDQTPIEEKHPYKIVITDVQDTNGDGAINLADVEYLIRNKRNTLTLLDGDGDFRSEECIELLKEADIVVTNPPFSLFREYVAQLIEYNKKFIIIGNLNAMTYKEVFPLIKDNKIWLGASIHSGDREFRVPDDYPLQAAGFRVDENGVKYIRVKGVRWYTNLDYPTRHEDIDLYRQYYGHEEDFPSFDNYDALNVDATKDIPEDYEGIIGVPITFLDKFNPDQFEILGITDRQNTSGLRIKKYTEEDSPKYNDLNARGVLKIGDEYKTLYARVLIRNKKPVRRK